MKIAALAAALFISTNAWAGLLDYGLVSGFSIIVPDNWQVIPDPVMRGMAAKVHAARPDTLVPDFSYGFQANAGDWFSLPYCLLRVTKTGKMPEEKLAELPKVDFSKVTDSGHSSRQQVIVSAEGGKEIFDPATHIIWFTSKMDLPEGGEMGVLVGSVQTEQGALSLYCYAPRESFDNFKPLFIQMIESIHPVEALRYKSH